MFGIKCEPYIFVIQTNDIFAISSFDNMTFGNSSTISDRRLKIAFACIVGTMHSVVYYSIKYLFIEDTRLDYVN